MRTIAFASIKGGVGKTTLAVHVAAALADQGKRTLLLDLDPQGHAGSMAGLEVTPDTPCAADAFGGRPKARLSKVAVEAPRPNLWVAPATVRMVAAERELFRWGHRLQAVERAIAHLDEPPEALVIDTPPHINAYTEAALAAGDVVVVPVPAMAHSLQGLDEIRATHEDVTDKSGGHLVVAVNMWDRRTTATNAAMEEAFADLEVPMMRTRITRAEVLNQAGLAYSLVYDFAPGSEVAGLLQELTRELWRLAGRS